MLVLGVLLAMAPVADPGRLNFQLMTSPAYRAFAARGEAMCPARKLRYLHPADLDGIEEAFVPTLPRRDQRRIAARNVGGKGCSPAGASCPAQHLLTAITGAGLLDGFTRFACRSAI